MFVVIIRLPPRSTRIDTPLPYTPLFRAAEGSHEGPHHTDTSVQTKAASQTQYRSCRKATRSNFGGRAGRRRFALNRRRKIWQCEQTNDAQRSAEHTSALQSLMRHSYAAFCLKKKNPTHKAKN